MYKVNEAKTESLKMVIETINSGNILQAFEVSFEGNCVTLVVESDEQGIKYRTYGTRKFASMTKFLKELGEASPAHLDDVEELLEELQRIEMEL